MSWAPHTKTAVHGTVGAHHILRVRVMACALLCHVHTRRWRGTYAPVDMCWALVAEEPHRPTTLNLEHCPLKANVSCLIFPLHQGKISSAQPLSGLDSPPTRELRATNEHITLPQSPFSFPLYNRKSNARASRLSHL
jgi:hypothetical protein